MDGGSRRIAVFGGTFDPFHNGHLRMAVEVREGLSLPDLFLVPSARPPHKPSRPMASAEDRLTVGTMRQIANGALFLAAAWVAIRRAVPE